MALLPFVLALAIGTPVDTNVTTLMVFKNGHGSVSERGEAVTHHGWVDIPEAPQASFDLIWLSVPDPGYTIDRAISSLHDQVVAAEPLPRHTPGARHHLLRRQPHLPDRRGSHRATP